MLNNNTYNLIKSLKNTNEASYEALCSYINDSKLELSFASHEINNLISFIYSSFQLIENRNPSVKNIEFWNDMGDSFKTLIYFMDRTSLYRNCTKTTFVPFNINDLLYELPDEIDQICSDIDNEFIFDTDIDDIYVNGDSSKIKSALIELIINACDASKQPICIYSHLTADQTYVSVEFSNYGTMCSNEGLLSDNQLLSLCQPFYTTKEKPHIGLGLSIVYMICQKHNIAFSIRQTDNITTASLKIPVIKLR